MAVLNNFGISQLIHSSNTSPQLQGPPKRTIPALSIQSSIWVLMDLAIINSFATCFLFEYLNVWWEKNSLIYFFRYEEDFNVISLYHSLWKKYIVWQKINMLKCLFSQFDFRHCQPIHRTRFWNVLEERQRHRIPTTNFVIWRLPNKPKLHESSNQNWRQL